MNERSTLPSPDAGPRERVFAPAFLGSPLIVGIVFLVAVLARLAVAREISQSPFFDIYVGDARNYHEWARRLAAGQSDADVFFQAPLYPYFLAALYQLFSIDPWLPRIAQAILAGVGCVLLSLSAGRLYGRTGAVVTGLLAALYAPGVFYDLLVHKTGIALFLGALIVFAMVRLATRGGTPGAALLTGAVVALAAMAIEHYLIVLPLVGAWLLLQPTVAWRERLLRVAALAFGAALVQAPVMARNYAVGGEPVVASTSSGMNFWIGNGAGANGHYRELAFGRGDIRFEQKDAERIASEAAGRSLSVGEASSWWLQRTLREVSADPLRWLEVMAKKVRLAVGDYEWPDGDAYDAYRSESPILAAAGSLSRFGLLLPLFVVGAVVAWPAGRSGRLTVAASIAILGVVVLFYVFGRYRYAALPFMFVVAGASSRLFVSAAGRKLAPAAGLAACVAAFAPVDTERKNPAINYYAAGVEAANLGRLDAASRLLLQAATMAPEEAYPYIALAAVYRRTHEWSMAEANLRRALAISPNLLTAYRLLGEALVGVGDDRARQGDAAGAARAYGEVLTLQWADKEDRENAQSRLAALAR